MPLETQNHIMAPTTLYAVNKFEQNEQNEDAMPLLYLKKRTWTLCNSRKHLLVPNSQTHLPKFQNEIYEKTCMEHATWDSKSHNGANRSI